MEGYALVLNAGSSSLKFCVFQRGKTEGWQVGHAVRSKALGHPLV